MKSVTHLKAVLTLLAVIGLLNLPACRKHTAADPFPATGQIAGWQKTGETRVFAAKDLWQYIDGDSERYIQAGVISTSTSDYNYQSRLEAVVDVHTMGTADGAQKILSGVQAGDASTIPIGDGGVAYSQSITFRKGIYLVRIIAYQSYAEGPKALLALAHGVESRL